ncbi:hypothetical protein FHS43_005931 [Streptosporangium becharense]|uniref:Putative metalloprotease n=1 Tax=Streptosporangium becharense TaxID=1816182 RepID=A0A7W9INU5_9ACTN|nr:hypothetical protein [Streptosporangium becharense]MBB2914619.1 hypothetical protein [Streptosporangium becharense]MBB5823464.1 putative metalloprotease [Streptosporangium becharense]
MVFSRWRTVRLALTALLATTLTAGAHGTAAASTADDIPWTTSADEAPATAPVDGGASADATAGEPDDLDEDIRSARYVVNGFWAAHWPEFFPGSYTSPGVFGAYDGATGNAPTCFGYRLPDDNALYCWPPYDYITWDADLMRMGYRQGDAWAYLVVAHEWGHAVQARIPESLLIPQLELQADCFAGAALFGAAEDGTLHFEPGDTDEIATALRQYADDTPWTDVSDHGSAAERLDAFETGARQGVEGCLP